MRSHGKYIDEKTIFVRKARGTQGVFRYSFTTRMGDPLAQAHVAGGHARLYLAGTHGADSALEAFAAGWLEGHGIPVLGAPQRGRRNPSTAKPRVVVWNMVTPYMASSPILVGQIPGGEPFVEVREGISARYIIDKVIDDGNGYRVLKSVTTNTWSTGPSDRGRAVDSRFTGAGYAMEIGERMLLGKRSSKTVKANPEKPKFKALEVYMDHLGSVYTRSRWQVSSSFEEWAGRFVPHVKATFRAGKHALSFAKQTVTDAVDGGFAPTGVVLEGGNEVFSYGGKKASRQRKANPRTRSTTKRRLSLRRRSNPYMMVRNLPDGIKNVLDEVGYGKKDISVEPGETYSPAAMSGAGLQAFVAVVDLGTGRHKVEWGSWGGPNLSERRQVDLDTTKYPMPYNGAVVKGHKGGGGPVLAHVEIHPENLQKLLPSGPTEELSEAEKTALLIIKSYKAGSRGDGFGRHDLGKYNDQNPVIRRLVEAGLVKVTGAGIQITMAGKNVAAGIKGIYV